MGKPYASRKPIEERPESDFYETPACLVKELLNLNILNKNIPIYEPMSGDGAISSVLKDSGFIVREDDIRITGKDFLEFNEVIPVVVTNPAFSIFTETVKKCQEICTDKFILLGKVNFFAAHTRIMLGTWKHLKHVYVFDRMVDYRTPKNDEGNFCVGSLVTAWMLWDKTWNEDYWMTSILDVNKYATLGSYERYVEKIKSKESFNEITSL
jgi:hypothetical protein